MNDERIAVLEARVARAKALIASLKARIKELKGPKKPTRISQANLAERVGISTRHINGILNGRKNPSVKLALRLQKATGVAREVWMFGGPEERRAAWRKMKAEAKP